MLNINLIEVNPVSDLELLLAWRSNPLIYENFLLQDSPLIWETHYDFWVSKTHRVDYMIFYQNRRVGHVAISKTNTEFPEIGIMIGEIGLWGRGLGAEILSMTLKLDFLKNYIGLIAKIKKSNLRSVKLFEKNGFVCDLDYISNGDTWGTYKLQLDNQSF